MKNKIFTLYSLCILSLLLLPTATADVELAYDSEPYLNGVKISINDVDYRARVRFTPTTDAIGGTLQQVKIRWCDRCTAKTGKFSLVIYECNDTYNGTEYRFNSTVPNQLGIYEQVDVSGLGFVVGSDDFCVEVRSQEDDVDLYVFFGGDNSSIDRSYHYGYPDPSWHSFVYLQSFVPSLRELAIRAVIFTEPPTTTTITTTTLYRSSDRGGGGGGSRRNISTCYDGIRNCHDGSCESGIDCGGPCKDCPTCFDEIQNQGEEGIDCGGPCDPCPTTTTIPTTTTTTTTTTTITTTTTTTTTIEAPAVVGRAVGFTPEGSALIAFLLFILLIWYLAYKKQKKGAGGEED
jgi:hypothetical protein